MVTIRAKVVLLGADYTGKTVFYNGEPSDYVPTTSTTCSFTSFTLPSEQHIKIEFLIHDTPGHLAYNKYYAPLLENPCFVIIFTDLSNRQSLDRCKLLYTSLPPHCTSCIVATKSEVNHTIERDLTKWARDLDITVHRVAEPQPEELSSVKNVILAKFAAHLVNVYSSQR
ncbi:hypothetical protein P9112_012661 [Eukaryota sp. TZLM1-RC]